GAVQSLATSHQPISPERFPLAPPASTCQHGAWPAADRCLLWVTVSRKSSPVENLLARRFRCIRSLLSINPRPADAPRPAARDDQSSPCFHPIKNHFGVALTG